MPLTEDNRPLAEPYAFALLTWPAVVGLMALKPWDFSDWRAIALALWLLAMQLAAYGRRRGAGFGNAMLLASGVVALACQTHPSPWSLAWLLPLFIVLFAAQQARLRTVRREASAISAVDQVPPGT